MLIAIVWAILNRSKGYVPLQDTHDGYQQLQSSPLPLTWVDVSRFFTNNDNLDARFQYINDIPVDFLCQSHENSKFTNLDNLSLSLEGLEYRTLVLLLVKGQECLTADDSKYLVMKNMIIDFYDEGVVYYKRYQYTYTIGEVAHLRKLLKTDKSVVYDNAGVVFDPL